jgi:hypothetical protein
MGSAVIPGRITSAARRGELHSTGGVEGLAKKLLARAKRFARNTRSVPGAGLAFRWPATGWSLKLEQARRQVDRAAEDANSMKGEGILTG